MGRRGHSANFIINDEVSGNDMLRANREISKLEGSVGKAAERLMVSWSADQIVRAATRTPKCQCPAPVADIKVNPMVAYNLARQSPARVAASAGVTSLAAQHGGSIPLHKLSKVLGPWDSLVEELIPRRRG